MRKISLALLFVLCGAVTLYAQRNCGCSILDPIGWRLEYSKATKLTFAVPSDSLSDPSFVFPGKRGHVNMLTRAWAGTTAGDLNITTRIVVTSGSPIFQLTQGTEPCTNPPAARPWLATTRWEWNDNDGNYDWNRWWSRDQYVVLGPGTTSIVAPLDPGGWSNVNGQLGSSSPEAIAHFWRVVNQGGRLGLVFGGGCSYGHGIYVTGGTATFTIMDYTVS